MPFAQNGLRRMDYGGNNGTVTVNLFSYTTPDAAAVVEAANYFNAAAVSFIKGDVIQASMVSGGTPVLKHYIVTSATGASPVTVAIQTVTAG